MRCTPAWMKRDATRLRRVIGLDGKPIEVPSPIAAASRDADAHAFAALTAQWKAVDGRRTVVIGQVKNGGGTLGADRNQSPAAEALLRAAIPADMPGVMTGDRTTRCA
jgi:hypothetical protein